MLFFEYFLDHLFNWLNLNVEEDEVEELKFESNYNSEDENDGPIDTNGENMAIPEGEEHPIEVNFGVVEDSKDEIKIEEIDTSDRRYHRGMPAPRKNELVTPTWFQTFFHKITELIANLIFYLMF